jgi:hypothetical protein
LDLSLIHPVPIEPTSPKRPPVAEFVSKFTQSIRKV